MGLTITDTDVPNPRRLIDRWELKVHVKFLLRIYIYHGIDHMDVFLTFFMYFAFDAYRFLIPKIAGDMDKFCSLLLRPGQMSHTIFNQFQN